MERALFKLKKAGLKENNVYIYKFNLLYIFYFECSMFCNITAKTKQNTVYVTLTNSALLIFKSMLRNYSSFFVIILKMKTIFILKCDVYVLT